MSAPAIVVEGLSKQYHIGARENQKTFREAITDALAAPFRRLRAFGRSSYREEDTIWALKDVSFEVQPGEVVGIIGRNGAGKSTLLKILTRITEPTEGRAFLNGRVGSLLEVGTGFHQELTGRENIYLSGAILGMGKQEIKSKFDEIVDFSGVEKFIDTPVKRYSSGMRVRLGFAVAAHLDPEILLIDEVLAVGDAEFQKKCLGKMDAVAKGGRTVLFVSHNLGAIRQLTSKSLLLQSGNLVSHGATDDVLARYLDSVVVSSHIYDIDNTFRRGLQLSKKVEFIRVELEDSRSNMFPFGADIPVKVTIRGNDDVKGWRFSVTLYQRDGSPLGTFFGPESHSVRAGEAATFKLWFRNLRLGKGTYCCSMATGLGNNLDGYVNFDAIYDVLHFEVEAPLGSAGTLGTWHSSWGPIAFDEPKVTRVT